MSRQPEIVLDSPYFESEASFCESPEDSKSEVCSSLSAAAKGSPSSAFEDAASATAMQFSSFNGREIPSVTQPVSKAAPSPSSVMYARAIEENKMISEHVSEDKECQESLKVPEVLSSMSMNDLVNHIENCISEQMTTGRFPTEKASGCQGVLDNIAQVLLSDTQSATGLDEKSLMKKVNSLCSLLQDPTITCSVQADGETLYHGKDVVHPSEGNLMDGSGTKQQSTLPRKDSLGDLLLHLPHIASLPKFPKLLYGVAEADDP